MIGKARRSRLPGRWRRLAAVGAGSHEALRVRADGFLREPVDGLVPSPLPQVRGRTQPPGPAAQGAAGSAQSATAISRPVSVAM